MHQLLGIGKCSSPVKTRAEPIRVNLRLSGCDRDQLTTRHSHLTKSDFQLVNASRVTVESVMVLLSQLEPHFAMHLMLPQIQLSRLLPGPSKTTDCALVTHLMAMQVATIRIVIATLKGTVVDIFQRDVDT